MSIRPAMVRVLLAFAAAVLLAGAAGPAGAQGRSDKAVGPARSEMPPATLLERQFEKIAFSAEYGGVHRRGRIVKWIGPIRVRIRGFNSLLYLQEVEAQLRELRMLTGLPIDLVNWSNAGLPPNLDINFTAQPAKAGLFDPTAPCRTIFHDSGFVIRRVEIFISPDNPAQRQHCIAEELTQAMGLANDSPLIANSIFNDDSRQALLAPWDTLMLRVLYDPRIRPGMTRNDAMPIVRDVIGTSLNGLPPAHRPVFHR